MASSEPLSPTEFGNTQRHLDMSGVVDEDCEDNFYATLVKQALMKRPASARPAPKKMARVEETHTSRPPMPSDTGGTTFYKYGKILVCVPKRGYRVFRHRTDRVDKMVRWRDDKEAAWAQALDLIDGKV